MLLTMRKAPWFIIAAVLGSMGCVGKEAPDHRITVVGTAEIHVPPDHLVAHLSVATLHMDPAESKKTNDLKTRSIVSFLSDLGIPTNDIATGYIRLQERYRRGRDGEQVFQGYEAETTINAIVRDIDLHDRLIEGSLGLGLNEILGVTFRSTEIVSKHREARKLAIRLAREKAEYLAAELGQGVGSAISIEELREVSRPLWSASNAVILEPDRDSSSFSPDSDSSSVFPESIKVREEVRVEFRLQDDA